MEFPPTPQKNKNEELELAPTALSPLAYEKRNSKHEETQSIWKMKSWSYPFKFSN